MRFVRVGTLDDPADVPLDVPIFTETKLPWAQLPDRHMALDRFNDVATAYAPGSLKRRETLFEAAGIADPVR